MIFFFGGIMSLICIFLMMNNIEYISICLLAISMFSVMKFLAQYLFFGMLVLFNFKSYLSFLNSSCLLEICITYFLHFCNSCFNFLNWVHQSAEVIYYLILLWDTFYVLRNHCLPHFPLFSFGLLFLILI